MEFEWDEDKRQAVIAKRNVDFRTAALIFEGLVIKRRDTRRDYGEERFISLGLVDGKAYYVVHTDRNEVIRVITAWKGGEIGKRKYQAGIARRN